MKTPKTLQKLPEAGNATRPLRKRKTIQPESANAPLKKPAMPAGVPAGANPTTLGATTPTDPKAGRNLLQHWRHGGHHGGHRGGHGGGGGGWSGSQSQAQAQAQAGSGGRGGGSQGEKRLGMCHKESHEPL